MNNPITFGLDFPILISQGQKTQTRRIVSTESGGQIIGWGGQGIAMEEIPTDLLDTQHVRTVICPYGNVGDRLWIQEPWFLSDASEGWSMNDEEPCSGWIQYAAGGDKKVTAPNFTAVQEVLPENWDWDFPDHWEYFPASTMPKWASRFQVQIADIRVERLNDISDQDAISEGCISYGPFGEYRGAPHPNASMSHRAYSSPKDAFKNIWEHLKSKDSWRDNPWVWVISFEFINSTI